MDKSKVLLTIIGVLAGFIAGFLFANKVNRQDPETSRTENTRPENAKQNPTNQQDQPDLSPEEIRRTIAKADQTPDDTEFQRKLGLALYRYTASQGDTSYLTDIARILKRAADTNSKDYELLVTLGDVHFDLGNQGDAKYFREAREWYQKALAVKPNDPNVRTDLGLTYYFDNPSAPEKAIAEYRKSLLIDPKHELTLQNLATALIAIKQYEEAQKRIEELRGINPKNQALPNLEAQLAQSKVKG